MIRCSVRLNCTTNNRVRYDKLRTGRGKSDWIKNNQFANKVVFQ